MAAAHPEVKTPAALAAQPPDYRTAVEKIVISHAINELYGAQVFDEVAVAFAPTPYWKWLTCRVAMEEYGHHVRFFRLGREIGIAEAKMLPQSAAKRPLSIFERPLRSWEEFCIIKLVADLAEIIQVEDLLKCSYLPLRAAAKATLPEEKFHAAFGEQSVKELIATPEGKAKAQAALDAIFPSMPAFFGAADSKNNELYRRFGIKFRTNREMRDDYLARVKKVVVKLDLTLPAA
ncbi:MAG: phenylacetate-CoA oxygenase subunit PaaI [Candidatus Eremiobacteraeota bacterium]|nr:phenylacetate-CoA oxygenase subunit PaaI [Candidatus Eremiobacteraeota bacterium]